MLTAPRRVLTAIALVAAIGCGDDDNGNGPPGSISISATPSALTLAQGASGTITVSLVRGGGFADPVAVAVDGAPSGVTTTVTPSSLTGTTSTATVTVNVAQSVAAGTYPLTIRASATGVGQATVSYTLTVTAAAAIDYQLSVNPGALNVAPGQTGQTTVNIARTNFTGAVTLSLENPPAGITATFNPAAPTGTSSQATISVASSVVAGNYNVQIKGAATGVPTLAVGQIDEAAAAGDRFVTVAVTVAAAADFTLSAAPNALTLAPGGNGTSTITIARTNLTADVALTLSNPPAGITGVFTPATLSGATLTSSLAISVAGSVAAGNYPVTVQGVGGSLTRTTVVTVTVGGGSGNIVWEFCNNEDVPLKFWRLSGTTWAEVPPTVGATTTQFSFTIASASGGIAYTLQNTSGGFIQGPPLARNASRSTLTSTRRALEQARAARRVARSQTGSLTDPYFDTFVLLAQTTELSGFRLTCAAPVGTVTKTFNVAGQAGGETGTLGYGGDGATVVTQTTQYNLSVLPGTYDWAYMVAPSPSLPDLTLNWTGYRVGRAEVAPGAAVAVNRTGAPALVSFPFTVSGGAQGSLWIFAQDLEGARGPIISFPVGPQLNMTGTGNMYFMQPGDRLGTDMNSLFILNTELIGNNVDSRTRIQFVGSGPPASGNFALPQSVPAFTTTPVGGAPVPSWTVAGQIPTDYQTTAATVNTILTGAGEGTLYTMTATRAWLQANGQSTSYSLVSPVLPNFLTAWAPASPLADAAVLMTGQNFTTTPVAGSVMNLGARLQAP